MNDNTLPPHRTPERQAEYKRRYRSKPEAKAKELKYGREYYALHKEELQRKGREWHANPANRAKKRSYKRTAEYRAYSAEYSRKWRPLHKEKVEGYKLKERAKREARYAALAGRPKPDACDICAGKIGNIVYDHCHKLGHFRGFLCDRCNTVLGLMEDNDTLLVAMAAYVKHNRTNHSTQFALPGV